MRAFKEIVYLDDAATINRQIQESDEETESDQSTESNQSTEWSDSETEKDKNSSESVQDNIDDSDFSTYNKESKDVKK